MVAARVRRAPVQSRALILESAERLLVEAGPSGVTVRAVAERVGMTDAGVAHHFGSRDELQLALLRHGGGRIRAAVSAAVAAWSADEADLDGLVRAVGTVYRDGYGALAVALHAAGWRDPGAGFLDPVVAALHAARKRAGRPAPLADTRLAVAALHQALTLEPVYGAAFRRSAGVPSAAADRHGPQLQWWARTLATCLGLTDTGGAGPQA